MKRFGFPDSLVLILGIIILAQLLTYIIPPGRFEREVAEVPAPTGSTFLLPGADAERLVLPEGTRRLIEGRRVRPGTFEWTEAPPLPWHAALTSIPTGMERASEVIFFVLIIGGVIAIMRETGAIDAVISLVLARWRNSPVFLIGSVTTVLALGSSLIGAGEEYMPFIPILVAMCLALRLDAMVAMGMVYVGAAIGYGCAAFNPFTFMIAKDIAGQDPATGFFLRWVLLALMLGVGIHHLAAYARSIQADAKRSLVADVDYSSGFVMPQLKQFHWRHAFVLGGFLLVLLVFLWGTRTHGWYLVELSALFLGLGLFSAVAGGVTPNRTARVFLEGASALAGTAVLIGFARTIEVVLSEGGIIDTVIYGISLGLEKLEVFGPLAPVLAAWGMLLVQSLFNLFVPSGSGQAYVTMPIMGPLADLTGVGRETAILAYQFGDGFTNMIIPTNALLMGMLLLARIPYQRWLRFALPLIGKIYLVALAVLAVCALLRFE